MNISIIVAVSRNNAIGNNNKLLYWLPNDMKRFKALTTGHTIIMGRKTFESLPKGALPNRRNMVLSRQDIRLEGAEVFSSLEEAIRHCSSEEEVFIIGGASVYKQAMAVANRIYLTCVDNVPEEADAFFPEVDRRQWSVEKQEICAKDDKHAYSYAFIDYQKTIFSEV